jgi:hypothetical protein
MALLVAARLLVALVPFRLWRRFPGFAGHTATPVDEEQRRAALRLAIHVRRAAARLPGATLCLPQAIALSVLLRRAGLAHAVVIAARPARFTGPGDRLHAWVEHGGETVLGERPGPWIETLRLDGRQA